MAGNRVRDHHRRQTAARRAGDPVALAETVDVAADGAPDPARVAEARDLVDALRARMTADEGQLLDLWMAGTDWPEVARRVGSTAEAVRKRLTRAIDRVARDLGWGEPA